MVTYDDLFTFVIMLCAVITLVFDFKQKGCCRYFRINLQLIPQKFRGKFVARFFTLWQVFYIFKL